MSASDPVADMLTKVRNAAMARHEKIQEDGHNTLRIFLKYDDDNNPVIHGVKKISTPGRRVYSGYKDLPRVYNGYGTIIVSTSSGVTTGKKATEKMVGGELVCTIW